VISVRHFDKPSQLQSQAYPSALEIRAERSPLVRGRGKADWRDRHPESALGESQKAGGERQQVHEQGRLAVAAELA